MEIDLIIRVLFDLIAFIALLWTIFQEFKIRNRVKKKDLLNVEDMEAINTYLQRLEGDLKMLRSQTNLTKSELFDYVESNLKPIANRLAVRATREKEKLQREEKELTEKKGGIIKYSDGTTA